MHSLSAIALELRTYWIT